MCRIRVSSSKKLLTAACVIALFSSAVSLSPSASTEHDCGENAIHFEWFSAMVAANRGSVVCTFVVHSTEFANGQISAYSCNNVCVKHTHVSMWWRDTEREPPLLALVHR